MSVFLVLLQYLKQYLALLNLKVSTYLKVILEGGYKVVLKVESSIARLWFA